MLSKKAFWELKIAKEIVNGIRCGFIVVEEIDNYCIMYSYGLDQDNVEIREQITVCKNILLKLGDIVLNVLVQYTKNMTIKETY